MFRNQFFVKTKSNKKLHSLDGADHFENVGFFKRLTRVKRLTSLFHYSQDRSDQGILIAMLCRRIRDNKILALSKNVIESFGSDGRGLPLGNLTSQWFANIYLHELDFYVKHTLHVQYYMRYNDDIIVLGADENIIRKWVDAIRLFVSSRLRLTIPLRKTTIVCLPLEVDVLGWCTDGRCVWVRPATVRKATARLNERARNMHPVLLESMCSYTGSGIVSILSTFM